MLDKILPPTDNLYKFKAISGLLLMVLSLFPLYLLSNAIEPAVNLAFYDKPHHPSPFGPDLELAMLDDIVRFINDEENEARKEQLTIYYNKFRADMLTNQAEYESIRRHFLFLLISGSFLIVVISPVSGIMGYRLMREGFDQWQEFVQTPLDLVLAKQADTDEKPLKIRKKRYF